MMNKRIKSLAECSDDEMVDMISAEILGDEPVIDAVTQVVANVTGAGGGDALLKKRMSQYIAMLRGMQLWYHGAHHVTRGVGFPGDHVTLYGEFYNEITEEFDGAVEKAIGLTNDESVADPLTVTKMAAQMMCNYPSPSKCTSLSIASSALEMENNYQQALDSMFEELEHAGALTLGLDDFLMANANKHEGYIYKLQQRVKTELED